MSKKNYLWTILRIITVNLFSNLQKETLKDNKSLFPKFKHKFKGRRVRIFFSQKSKEMSSLLNSLYWSRKMLPGRYYSGREIIRQF
jgi:hypothetical protein